MITRKEAAINRIACAVAKIEEARQKLEEACAALAPLDNASVQYKKILREVHAARELRYDVELFLTNCEDEGAMSVVELLREPDEGEEAKYAPAAPDKKTQLEVSCLTCSVPGSQRTWHIWDKWPAGHEPGRDQLEYEVE